MGNDSGMLFIGFLFIITLAEFFAGKEFPIF